QLAEVERLARKHRRPPEELADLEEQLRGELERCHDLEGERPALEQELAALRERAERAAQKLHEGRMRGARRLEAAVAEELGLLCLPGASLGVHVKPAALSSSGASQVELSFTG